MTDSDITTAAPTPPSRREMRREWIDNRITDAALNEVVTLGADKLALADVAKAAGVSRTTLYKYYPDRDLLLSAVSDRVRTIYAEELAEAVKGHDAPEQRLHIVLNFMQNFHERWHAEQMIRLQLQSVVQDINRNFTFYHEVLSRALAPTLAAMRHGGLDPAVCELFVDMLIRIQLSNALVPLGARWQSFPELALSLWKDMSGR